MERELLAKGLMICIILFSWVLVWCFMTFEKERDFMKFINKIWRKLKS